MSGRAPQLSRQTTIRYREREILDLDDLRASLDESPPLYIIPVVPALPARLLDLERVEDIPKLVEQLVSEAREHGLKKQFDRDVYSDAHRPAAALSPEELSSSEFVEELRQILIELLENVKLHAYDESLSEAGPHLAGLFARFRHGLNDARVAHLRRMLLRQHQDEQKYCPRLQYAAAVAQMGSIEIFVADAGIGLSTHLRQRSARRGFKSQYTHPLRAYFTRLAGEEPFSRFGTAEERLSKSLSAITGLKHLVRLLGRGQGFLRALSHLEWAGTACPLPTPSQPSTSQRDPVAVSESVPSGQPVLGTHWLIRASTGEPMELEHPWRVAVLGNRADPTQDPTLAAWSDDQTELARWRKVIFEVRDDGGADEPKPAERFQIEVGRVGQPQTCILWRPSKELRRNKVARTLEEITNEHPGAPVLVADQYIRAALTTEWTLSQGWLRAAQPPRVSLLSNHLAAVDLVPQRVASDPPDTFRLRPRISKLLSASPYQGLSLAHVVAALRQVDGRDFWAAIARYDSRFHLLLSGAIRWKTGGPEPQQLTLKTYLDFPQAIHLWACRWTGRRALGRFLAYCSPLEDPIPVDHLLEPLISGLLYRNNARALRSDDRANQPEIQLGSVVVSESTLIRLRTQSASRGSEGVSLIAHFLRHPAMPATTTTGMRVLSLLPWTEALEGNRPKALDQHLERVTDTPIVGPQGTRYWKAFRAVEKTSLYGIAPGYERGVSVGEAYAFWQRQGLLRLGHWHHGSHHDFVGLDLHSALRLDRLGQQGVVGKFLLAHLQRLDPAYHEQDGFPPCQLLVCVANEGTLRITNEAFKAFPWLVERTVFLPLVQRQRRAMRLRVSPIAAESIRHRIAELRLQADAVRVLLLDTHIGSARSFLELSNLLHQLGANDVHSVALLDRSRWPNEAWHFQRNFHRFHVRLWRLDIDHLAPSLGPHPSAGCHLCDAVAVVQRSLEDLPRAMKTTRQRLQDWVEVGRIRTLAKASPLAGLPAISLPRPQRVHFGHPLSGEGELTVEIFEAGALATILLEAVTASGVHEQVNEMLDWLERKTEVDPHQAQRVLDAEIYILLGQALLMRHDVEFSRRVEIYRRLLGTLFKTRETTPATAFAGLVLSGADTDVARGLAPFVLAAPELRSTQLSIDCALAVAQLATKTSKLRVSQTVRSLQRLVASVDGSTPHVLGDLFLLLGFRDGEVHHTRIQKLLAEPLSRIWGNRAPAIALIELVLVRLRRLAHDVDWLPTSITAEEILAWYHSIKQRYDRLTAVSAGGDHPSSGASRAWCRALLASLRRRPSCRLKAHRARASLSLRSQCRPIHRVRWCAS